MSWVRLTVEFSPSADRDMRALDRQVQRRVLLAVTRYAETGAGDVKRLQGEPGYRLRVGDYRAVFEVHDGQIAIMLVVCVGHRREVYR